MWKIDDWLNTNDSVPLDENIVISVKALSFEHAEDLARFGHNARYRLPDVGHGHEINQGSLEDILCTQKSDLFKEVPSYGERKNKCLPLGLVLARSFAISREGRNHIEHDLDVKWNKIVAWRYSQTAINNIDRNLAKLEAACPEIMGTQLDKVIPKFCQLFKDTNVFVISTDTGLRRFKYKYPETGAVVDRKYNIFLFQEKVGEGKYHIKYIDYIKQYCRKIGGIECLFGCGRILCKFQYPHENCKQEVCKICHFTLDRHGHFSETDKCLFYNFHCDGSQDNIKTCSKCKITTGSKICEKRHKTKKCRSHIDYFCELCESYVYKDSPKPHKCGEKRCRDCRQPLPRKVPTKLSELTDYEAIHQCTYKRAKLPIRLPNLGYIALGIDEQNCCIRCRNQSDCKWHKEKKDNLEPDVKAVVRIFFFGSIGKLIKHLSYF